MQIDLSPIALFEDPTIVRLARTIQNSPTNPELLTLFMKLDALSEEHAWQILCEKRAKPELRVSDRVKEQA